MKKIFIFIFSFFFLLNSIYGFNILDSSNQQRTYFSINNPNVFVQTTQNLSNYIISYNLNNILNSKILNLTSCQNKFCSNFSLLDFINTTNSTFSGGTIFNLTLNNISKFIFLDIEKPKFNFLNFSINKSNLSLNINFNYSDNFKVLKINIYKKENNNLIFINNISNSTNFNLVLNKSGNLTLVFKIFDFAQNFDEVSHTFLIEDIFKPKILSTNIILENGNYKLNFSAIDNSLGRYEVSQNNISLSEIITGLNISKIISIPFYSGKIKLLIYDNNSNFNSINLSLTNKIVNIFSNKFSNKKEFKFTSNANSCILINIDTNLLNKQFLKNSNSFSLNLDISKIKAYNLKISCELDNFKEIITTPFYYDIQKPNKSVITIKKLNNGFFKIIWNKSFDLQSNVTYKLYKNSNLIYSGNNLYFTDRKVSYPNSYSYYLKVEDLAKNFINSNKISIIPKKINVNLKISKNFDLGNIVKKSIFKFNISTEKNVSLNIIQITSGKLILNKTINSKNKTFLNYTLNLSSGINKISIIATDALGNKKNLISSIIFDSKILNQIAPRTKIISNISKINKIIPKKIISNNNFSNLSSKNNINNLNNSNSFFLFWIWIIFWLLILGVFIKTFILNEDKLKQKLLKYTYSKKRQMNNFNLKRKKDTKLERSLNKIKLNRSLKQQEAKIELQRKMKASKKVLTEFEKKKFEDLNQQPNKEISFSNNFRIKSKRRINKIKKNSNYNSNLKQQPVKSIGEIILEKINKMNFKKEKKNDEFSNYIQKKRNETSWKTTKEYLLKTKLEKERKKNKIFDEIQKNKDLLLFEKNKKIEEKELLRIKKEKQKLEKNKFNEEKKTAMNSLNDYISKKSKKRKLFFAEKHVNFDLKNKKN